MQEKLNVKNIHLLIKDNLKFEVDEVEAIEIIGYKVYIKLHSEELVNKTCAEKNEIEYTTDEGIVVKVKVEKEEKYTYVRVHSIPVHLPNEAIASEFKKYGKVETVTNETWGNNLPYPVKNGVRVVKLIRKENIPSYVQIYGRRTWVTYPGQIQTCKKCNHPNHKIEDCPENLSNKFKNRTYPEVTTYAGKTATNYAGKTAPNDAGKTATVKENESTGMETAIKSTETTKNHENKSEESGKETSELNTEDEEGEQRKPKENKKVNKKSKGLKMVLKRSKTRSESSENNYDQDLLKINIKKTKTVEKDWTVEVENEEKNNHNLDMSSEDSDTRQTISDKELDDIRKNNAL